jgi:MSHA pilin protein MshC
MIIIGALAAVSTPIFFDRQAFDERGYFDDLVGALRYAQKYAVSSGCTTRVVTNATSYSLFRAATFATCNGGTYTQALPHPADPGQAFANTAPTGIAVSASDFTFSPSGSASTTVTITVGARSVRVVGPTGFVQVL